MGKTLQWWMVILLILMANCTYEDASLCEFEVVFGGSNFCCGGLYQNDGMRLIPVEWENMDHIQVADTLLINFNLVNNPPRLVCTTFCASGNIAGYIEITCLTTTR